MDNVTYLPTRDDIQGIYFANGLDHMTSKQKDDFFEQMGKLMVANSDKIKQSIASSSP